MSNIYIASVGKSSNLSKDSTLLSLGKSAQTGVKTSDMQQMNMDFSSLYANMPIFLVVIIIALLVFVFIAKVLFKPKPKKPIRRINKALQAKSRNDAPNFPQKKEQKIKHNYATPANLNACIRTFLERTKHK